MTLEEIAIVKVLLWEEALDEAINESPPVTKLIALVNLRNEFNRISKELEEEGR